MVGRIVAISCGIYSVEAENIVYQVSARGIFRLSKIKPIVGDIVNIDVDNLVITEIKDRVSYLKRPLIANATQVLIVESLIQPDFSYLLAFKYATYANMYGLKTKLILTKEDSFSDESKMNEIVDVFNTIGIETFIVSNKTKKGLESVKNIFKNELTCLIGQTGVGKSSLLNAIDENFERKVGQYSYALHRGKHETKEVILLPYEGGYIADTPGFSSLELDLFKEDLAQFFPKFDQLASSCYFSNCLHLSESRCAVKEAIEKGEIPQIAYDNYKKLSEELISKSKRYDQ